MSPLKDTVLDLIKQRPGLTALQLAAEAKCEADQVLAVVTDAVRAGQVLCNTINKEDGRVKVYQSNPAYLGWTAAPRAKAPSSGQTDSSEPARRKRPAPKPPEDAAPARAPVEFEAVSMLRLDGLGFTLLPNDVLTLSIDGRDVVLSPGRTQALRAFLALT